MTLTRCKDVLFRIAALISTNVYSQELCPYPEKNTEGMLDVQWMYLLTEQQVMRTGMK